MEMVKTKTLNSKFVELVNDLGIFRCEEKKVDCDGNTYGQTMVWYEVCVDDGEGDCIECFKTLRAARRYAEKY